MMAEFFDGGTVMQEVGDAMYDAEQPVSSHSH
jgi:hypothetical protein